ncbi:hypothetical protein MTO96_036349, partial [Rhipicephalus appendiculatus]
PRHPHVPDQGRAFWPMGAPNAAYFRMLNRGRG